MNLTSVIIQTQRLLITPITPTYRKDIFREFQEPVTLYMQPLPAKDISETDTFISESIKGLEAGNNLQLVILKKDTQEFLGCAGLHQLDIETPEMGVWIKQSAQGNGYGKEAMTAIKQWADENLSYTYIVYPVAEENTSSRKIPESLGGEVKKEYDKQMPSGREYHFLEYWIPSNKKSL